MNATPACTRIPREIVDLITEELKGDKKTLGACCSISTSADIWTASCRARIFKDLTVHVHRPGRSIADFVQFLESSSQVVLENIQLLCIRQDKMHKEQYSIDVGVVHLLLRKLPRLYQLSLQRLCCVRQQDMPLEEVGFKLRSLKYRHNDGTTSAFLQLLSLFSEVGELHLQSSPGAQPLDVPTTSLPAINSLILEGVDYPMVSLARDVLQITSLPSLSMPSHVWSRGEAEFTAMLAQYGQGLHKLQILLDMNDLCSCIQWENMRVDTLTSLKSVSFIISTSTCLQGDAYYLPSITHFLETVPSVGLSEINLIYGVPKDHIRFGHREWQRYAYPLDQGNTIPPFEDACCKISSLRRVYFGWTAGNVLSLAHPTMVDPDIALWRTWDDRVRSTIKTDFPRLEKGSLLRFN